MDTEQTDIKDLIAALKKTNSESETLQRKIEKMVSKEEARKAEFAEGFKKMKENIDTKTIQPIIDRMNALADQGKPQTAAERLRAKEELKTIQQMVENVSGKKAKELLLLQQQQLEKMVAKQSGVISSVAKSIGDQMGNFTSVLAGIMADSPIVGMVASMATNAIKTAIARKRELKQQRLEALRERKEALAEQRDALKQEIGEKIEMSNEDIEKMSDEQEKQIELLERIADSLEGKSGQAKIDEETRREANRRQAKMTKAKKKTGKIDKPEDDEPFSLTALKVKLLDIFSKWTGKLAGLIGAALFLPFKKMKGWVLKAAKVSGAFIVKDLPKLLVRVFPPAMIIATMFSGAKAAFDEYNKSGDILEATRQFLGGIVEFVSFGIISKEDFNNATQKIGVKLSHFMSWITGPEGVPKIWEKVKSWFGGIVKEAIKASKDNLKKITAELDKMFNFTEVWKSITNIPSTISKKINEIVDSIINFDYTKAIKETLPDWMSGVFDDEEQKPAKVNRRGRPLKQKEQAAEKFEKAKKTERETHAIQKQAAEVAMMAQQKTEVNQVNNAVDARQYTTKAESPRVGENDMQLKQLASGFAM